MQGSSREFGNRIKQQGIFNLLEPGGKTLGIHSFTLGSRLNKPGDRPPPITAAEQAEVEPIWSGIIV